MTKPGAYILRDIISRKFYIGSSGDPDNRYQQHLSTLKSNTHQSVNLQALWNLGNVEFSCIVFPTETLEDARALEQALITENLDNPLMLNIGMSAVGGDNITRNPNREEIVKKISVGLKRRNAKARENPEEWKKLYPGCIGVASGMFGRTHTPEAIAKMKAATIGRVWHSGYKQKLSDEQRAERSKQASERVGERNSFFGKTHSEETKEKIRLSRIGNIPANSKKVEVDGVVYESLTEASRQFGISPALMVYRINSDKPKYSGYKYLLNA